MDDQSNGCSQRKRRLTVGRPTNPICEIVEHAVSLALDIPLGRLRSRTRGTKDVARCRQVAMYLAITTFSVPMCEVSAHFGRDRSTIAHALGKIEDERDDESGEFELLMLQLEAMLGLTRDVWENRERGQF